MLTKCYLNVKIKILKIIYKNKSFIWIYRYLLENSIIMKKIKITESQLANLKVYLMNEVKELSEDENPCWDGYEMVGMKDKDGKEVPNCVPKK